MTNEELKILQSIAEQILLLCSSARIDAEEFERRAKASRLLFHDLKKENADRCRRDVDSQENKDANSQNAPENLFLGDDDMIKLKYGQGHIRKRTRLRQDGCVSITYEGRYYCAEEGKYKSVYAKTQADCINALRLAKPRRKKGPSTPKLTFGTWICSWYNEFKKGALKPSTAREYEKDINDIILPALGNIALARLDTLTLQHFFNGITHGNLRKKVYLLVSASLKKATVLRKIPFNPCDAIELPKYKAKKRRAFEYDEQVMLLNSPVSSVFWFLCCTGLRIGEFLALTKDDFNLDEHYFVINKALVDGVLGTTKSEASNRIVYFTDELFSRFDFKLLGTFTYEGVKTAFRRAIYKYRLKGVSIHSTRHTFATLCHACALNEKMLQSMLGHSTLAMTQDVYTHLLKKGTSPIKDYIKGLCTHICTNIL